MKRLLLLRHAKSSWDAPELADHDRPLAPRGRRAAKVISQYLRRQSLAPALVLCSSAHRTRETLERIRPALGEAAAVDIEHELYEASEQGLLARLRAIPDEVASVLLIGHNPALEQLAVSLAARGERLDALQRKFPTAALATLDFEGSWKELGPGSAELTDFVTPKQLG